MTTEVPMLLWVTLQVALAKPPLTVDGIVDALCPARVADLSGTWPTQACRRLGGLHV